MRIRVDFEVPDSIALSLAGRAYALGWSREEPRKRWSEGEIKEAIRVVASRRLEEMVNEQVEKQT